MGELPEEEPYERDVLVGVDVKGAAGHNAGTVEPHDAECVILDHDSEYCE